MGSSFEDLEATEHTLEAIAVIGPVWVKK